MYRQYYISFLLFLVTSVICVGCSEENLNEQNLGKGNLTLTFTCSKSQARAIEDVEVGKPEWNENKIETLDCFFYKGTDNNNDAQSILHLAFKDLNAEKEVTVNSSLRNEIIKKLFSETNNQCRIYAIANLPSTTTIDKSKTSINELKAMKVSANFVTKDPQTSFVMDCNDQEKITYDQANKSLKGNISLNRTAAKISLTITKVTNVVDANGKEWTPDLKNMKVTFHNGVSKSSIDPDLYPPTDSSADKVDFNSENAISFKSVDGGATGTVYEQTIPFYSYASDWSKQGREAYILLVVPWQKEGETSYQSCYYQIPVNPELKNMKRNQYYKINLSVSTLGTFDEVKPELLKPSYIIMDWSENQKVDIDADLQKYRYLIISPTKFVVHNQDSLVIPYASSHAVKISKLSFSHKDFSKKIPEDVTTKIEPDKIINNKNLYLGANNTIKYKNILQNDFNKANFDFSPYTIKFTIEQKDDPNFNEEVEIIQYPAIYAEYETNSNYVENPDFPNSNSKFGYAFVNGYQDENYGTTNDRFGDIKGYWSDDRSPNMYIFTITSVKGTDYIIGDPREKEPSLADAKVTYNQSDSPNNTAWIQAPNLYDNTKRGLKYYYATDNSEATKHVIAPKFRIASSYAALSTDKEEVKNLDALKKRCASYQEDGYPAGRWRLPTQAEFQFIITLVNNKKLPLIYISGYAYWCAHGLGTPIDEGNGKWRVDMNYIEKDDNGHSTRCVYDEWYWGNEKLQDKTKFTWGDKAR